MRRLMAVVLTLALAGAVHLDWHLARPPHLHHGLSVGWERHWLFAALAFAAVGWAVARLWPGRAAGVGARVAAVALLLAQGVEPAAEVALYARRLGYPDEPGRWAAFALATAAGLPAYALALWLCRPRRPRDAAPLPTAA